MLSEGNFIENLKNLMDDPDSYSQEEFYKAFLEVTERYLTEMVNTIGFERALIDSLGEDEAEETIAMIAATDPEISELDEINAREMNTRKRIDNLLNFITSEYTFDDEDDYDNEDNDDDDDLDR